MPAAAQTRRRRVPAMAPEERRAALIEATVPLLHKHGLAVSTRQIAQAAGVAEGTIFGVFPDKDSLVQAALLHALDPGPTLAALAALDRGTDLRERLSRAAELINQRFADTAHLISAFRSIVLTTGATAESRQRMAANRDRLLAALTDVIEPDRQRLRHSPATAARLLLMVAGANTYGPFGEPDRLTGEEMAAVLLDGLLIAGSRSAHPPGDRSTHPAGHRPADSFGSTEDGGAARC